MHASSQTANGSYPPSKRRNWLAKRRHRTRTTHKQRRSTTRNQIPSTRRGPSTTRKGYHHARTNAIQSHTPTSLFAKRRKEHYTHKKRFLYMFADKPFTRQFLGSIPDSKLGFKPHAPNMSCIYRADKEGIRARRVETKNGRFSTPRYASAQTCIDHTRRHSKTPGRRPDRRPNGNPNKFPSRNSTRKPSERQGKRPGRNPSA